MKNVVECPREFIVYFNALETTCDNNAILAIDIKSVSLNVKVQSALGLVLCNFSWCIFPGGPFKSTTEKKKEEEQ